MRHIILSALRLSIYLSYNLAIQESKVRTMTHEEVHESTASIRRY